MEPLYINVALYLITFLIYFIKDRQFGVREAVFLLYAIFGVASIVSINKGIYFDVFGVFAFHQLDLTPLFLNYAFVLLFAQSLNGLSKVKYDLVSFDSTYVKIFEWGIIALSIINLFFMYMWSQLLSGLELADIYEAGHSGDMELTFDNKLWNIIYFRSKQLLSIGTPIVYIIEFMNICMQKKVKRSALIILLVFIPTILGLGLSANRGGIVFAFASIFFFLILFWPKFPKSTKKLITIAVAAVAVLGVAYLVAISLSRYDEDSEGAVEGVIRYFGESYPNLTWQIWPYEGHHLYGMRTFPTIYELFGGDIPTYNDEGFGGSQFMYEMVSGWPILIFKTFYGDMFVEFGPFIPFVIVVVYLVIVNLMQAKLKYSVFSLLIFHFSFMALIFGLFDNYLIESNVLNLIIFFLLALWFNSKLVKKKEENPEPAELESADKT